jgi:hypothetical protein
MEDSMDFTDQNGKVVPNAFETDSKGQLVNRPLLGWTTANVTGAVVLLRLNYAETAAEMKNGGKKFQVSMKPDQARQLAAMLLEQAESAA